MGRGDFPMTAGGTYCRERKGDRDKLFRPGIIGFTQVRSCELLQLSFPDVFLVFFLLSLPFCRVSLLTESELFSRPFLPEDMEPHFLMRLW